MIEIKGRVTEISEHGTGGALVSVMILINPGPLDSRSLNILVPKAQVKYYLPGTKIWISVEPLDEKGEPIKKEGN